MEELSIRNLWPSREEIFFPEEENPLTILKAQSEYVSNISRRLSANLDFDRKGILCSFLISADKRDAIEVFRLLSMGEHGYPVKFLSIFEENPEREVIIKDYKAFIGYFMRALQSKECKNLLGNMLGLNS